MELGTKALYNSVRFRALQEGDDIHSRDSNSWKVANYRNYSLEQLFLELSKLGRTLDKETFLAYSEECDSPEDLLNLFVLEPDEENPEAVDQFYLILFELWRRLIPERPSITILCDELDQNILAYDLGEGDSEPVLESTEALFEVIQRNVDEGMPSQEAFKAIEAHCAHDLRRFYTDFILDLLDEGAEKDAEELFFKLSPLLELSPWALLIQARFIAKQSPKKASSLLKQALHLTDKGAMQIGFYAEATQALRWIEDDSLCAPILDAGYRAIKSWEDVITYLEILSDFVSFYDLDQLDARVQKITFEIEEKMTANKQKVTASLPDHLMKSIQSLSKDILEAIKMSS